MKQKEQQKLLITFPFINKLLKMSKDLLNIQRNFVSHLKNKEDFEILAQIKSASKIESLARLNIYRNNVFGGFGSVLSDIYTITKKELGEKKFDKYVEEYIKKYPSQSGNLNEYGRYFPEIIRKNLKNYKINYLYELAKLEALLFSTYFLEDEKRKFNIEKYKKLPEEKFSNLKFYLDLTVNIISSKYPIYSIYSKKKSRSKKQEYLMIERIGSNSEAHNISKEEYLFLDLVKKGKNLYQIFELIAKKNKKFDIGATLNKFIENSVIVDFSV